MLKFGSDGQYISAGRHRFWHVAPLTIAASTESHLKDFLAFFRRAEKTILSIMKGDSL
ncbi:MAG: hypothetical protein ACREDM_05395 [Methylocella sp.]